MSKIEFDPLRRKVVTGIGVSVALGFMSMLRGEHAPYPNETEFPGYLRHILHATYTNSYDAQILIPTPKDGTTLVQVGQYHGGHDISFIFQDPVARSQKAVEAIVLAAKEDSLAEPVIFDEGITEKNNFSIFSMRLLRDKLNGTVFTPESIDSWNWKELQNFYHTTSKFYKNDSIVRAALEYLIRKKIEQIDQKSTNLTPEEEDSRHLLKSRLLIQDGGMTDLYGGDYGKYVYVRLGATIKLLLDGKIDRIYPAEKYDLLMAASEMLKTYEEELDKLEERGQNVETDEEYEKLHQDYEELNERFNKVTREDREDALIDMLGNYIQDSNSNYILAIIGDEHILEDQVQAYNANNEQRRKLGLIKLRPNFSYW